MKKETQNCKFYVTGRAEHEREKMAIFSRSCSARPVTTNLLERNP